MKRKGMNTIKEKTVKVKARKIVFYTSYV